MTTPMKPKRKLLPGSPSLLSTVVNKLKRPFPTSPSKSTSQQNTSAATDGVASNRGFFSPPFRKRLSNSAIARDSIGPETPRSSVESPDRKRRRLDSQSEVPGSHSEPPTPSKKPTRIRIGGLKDIFQQKKAIDEPEIKTDDKSRTKTQNDFTREYVEKRQDFLDCRVAAIAPEQFTCANCEGEDVPSKLYRCRDCHGRRMLCGPCLVELHQQTPFHRLEIWSGGMYHRGTLGERELEFVLHMGHGGRPCPKASNSSAVIFGDIGGFFSLQVSWCGCGETGPDKDNAKWKQLVRMGYVPASFIKPQTAFSTNLFERMHLELMEGHTSLKSVNEVLKRLSHPNFPDLVDNRYVELMRVYRWHRDLTWILEGGGYHDPRLCEVPADPDDPAWVYRIYVTMDGNFKLEQLRTRNGDLDVRLRDNQGFLVGIDKYMEFLERTKDWVQPRSTCNAFYNQDHADVPVDHLMWRGLVSLACARHGCFFPNGSMNIQVGEQQRLLDYGLSQLFQWVINVLNKANVSDAVKINSITIIYDIMCQYKVKFHERLSKGGLTEPTELELSYFIGKFHLGGHKEDCWAMYTLDLLLGGGRQDGEILETLWSGLNKSKSTVRSMAGGFRQEFLDDLIQDSNWRKLIGGDQMLIRRLERAYWWEEKSRLAFMDIGGRVSEGDRTAWEEEGRLAHETRDPARLKVYESVKGPGKFFDEVKRDLALEEIKLKAKGGGDVGFICGGLTFELNARRLRKKIKEYGNKPTLLQKYQMSGELKGLLHRYNAFQEEAVTRIQKSTGNESMPKLRKDKRKKGAAEIDWSLYREDENDEVVDPELLVLCLPSNMDAEDRARVGWEELARQEIALREGMIYETLMELRLQLGQRVMRYVQLRRSDNQKETGRKYQGLKRQMEEIKEIVEDYRKEVAALERLQSRDEVRKRWKEIKEADLTVTTEDRTTKTKLAWFWRDVNVPIEEELEENPQMESFYKVNYLRAKARWDRWEEEVILVKKEMTWRISWFEHAKEVWTRRAELEEISEGARVYARMEAHKWDLFAAKSRQAFSKFLEV
ncbi:hypothetical protein VKT23_008580 [Stygiomarasmius scandens]|uniref:CxC2-like cysteine cluster KDZ transposase-associated domain-containing protein n=1 Tax=Marasmiellus scandens TaxID=2682957 RepID=A0ABR1JHG0_9AGAR